jgi:hypothetical protein
LSHFEYLALAFGLVFTLAALRLVGGLPYALEPGRRYWIHAAATLMILIAGIGAFWNFWSLQEVEWTFPRFALALSIPGFLYYNAATIVPENPADVTSWRQHYDDVRLRFFIGLVCWAVAAMASDTVNLGTPFLHPVRLFHGLVVIFGVVGAAFSSHRVHAALFLIMTALGLLMLFTLAASATWMT